MIRKEMLRPGDLLFFKPSAKWSIGSWLVTWGQNIFGKSPIHGVSYNHVAIVDKDVNYLLESRWPKSHRKKIAWEKLEKQYDIELWRVRNVKPQQIRLALNWAYMHLNEWYDLGLFLFGWFDRKKAEVCSTFIAKAWRNAGILFEYNKDMGVSKFFHSPDELVANINIIKRIA